MVENRKENHYVKIHKLVLQLVHTAILNRQPVELLQNGCNMSILSMVCNNTSKGILNTLQLLLIET